MSTLIQKIPLYFNGASECVAELRQGFSLQITECWQNFWVPARERYKDNLQKVPEHFHWDWLKKATFAIFNNKEDKFFWIDCENIVQGIMFVDTNIAYYEADKGKQNVYVHFLEVAPWNYFKDEVAGYYKGVGSILLMAAINFSDSCGYEGRIALESLPQSESFYFQKGMVAVKKSTEPSPLKHFELPTEKAKELLRGMRK